MVEVLFFELKKFCIGCIVLNIFTLELSVSDKQIEGEMYSNYYSTHYSFRTATSIHFSEGTTSPLSATKTELEEVARVLIVSLQICREREKEQPFKHII